MTPYLLGLLCDPVTKEPLELRDAQYEGGRVVEGTLHSASGRVFPIRNGVPRFAGDARLTESVHSFGDQWNTFNFVDFRDNWLNFTVANTFGSTEVFKGRVVVDAGAGSGAQALWLLQAGAAHVILLELSHSVDGVVQANLRNSGFSNWDVIQCSIDAPPIRDGSIAGIVMCHNVIQHTPSVQRTAEALFRLVAPGGEYVFNCYPKNDEGWLRWARLYFVYRPLRGVLSRMPFAVNYAYATAMAALRQIPLIGFGLEKVGFCVRGRLTTDATGTTTLLQSFRTTRLNTFDCFGSHQFQHLLSDADLMEIVSELQPDAAKVLNVTKYFSRPAPIGCALRVLR
jgi:ubiquinone/menaquinone biosynthesis C-methylase UbiE